MPKKHSGPKYDMEQRKLKALQRRVLQHLKAVGPQDYDLVYVFFDPGRTGDIASVLRGLLEGNYIKGKENDSVEITEQGLSILENKEYWL